jgi:hypothetical protein
MMDGPAWIIGDMAPVGLLVLLPGCHQDRIAGEITVPDTR